MNSKLEMFFVFISEDLPEQRNVLSIVDKEGSSLVDVLFTHKQRMISNRMIPHLFDPLGEVL